MRSRLRTVLEIAVPLLAVFIFIGGSVFELPPSVGRQLRQLFSTEDGASPLTSAPQVFSKQNLDWALETLAEPPDAQLAACPPAAYTTHIYSTDPPIIYIDDFLSAAEITHLKTLAEDHYAAATIFSSTGSGEHNDTTIRHSEKAPLPRADALVACVEERARAFQGWRPDTFVEKLWAQRYRAPAGHYAHHFDWSSDGGARGGRVSSFMVWLNDGFAGGGTSFPRVPRREGAEWCARVDCGSDAEGTTWRPRSGSAVYWENFRRSDGVGYAESWHAGLPVTSGEKIGLNIWSWWQPGLAVALGKERERRSA